jgi:hypothetical protein
VLGERAPVLLVIEDIHWADSSTRAFLAYVARSLGDERALVVASYRLDELHRRHPLRPLVAELERDARVRRVELAPLTRDELASALSDILDTHPTTELVERLYARSEGNPLFREVLLAAGRDGRGALPPTLRDALMLRIERLPDAAQELTRVLAVGGRLDHDLLAEAAGLDARELRESLRAAVTSHLVVVDADGNHAFRHAPRSKAISPVMSVSHWWVLGLAASMRAPRRAASIASRLRPAACSASARLRPRRRSPAGRRARRRSRRPGEAQPCPPRARPASSARSRGR